MSLQTSEMAAFLQEYPWDYFMTVTCRFPRRDSIALMRDINQALTVAECDLWSNLDKINLPGRIFIACEPHKFSYNLHAHGLIWGGPGLYPPKLLQKTLDKRFGRSQVGVCSSQQQVSSYCSKYVTKRGDGDNYDFFGNWYRRPT